MEKGLYERLSSPLPQDGIQRTTADKTKKGYDTTGYGYQYVVDRLNEVCGIDGWGFTYTVIKESEGQYRDKADGTPGMPYHDITVDISMWINAGKGSEGSVRAERQCAGGHIAPMYGDALKGAITSGLKKTAALFGIGADAYRGEIDDDNKPLPGDHADRGAVSWVRATDGFKPRKPLSDDYKAKGIGKWTKEGENFVWWWKKGEEWRQNSPDGSKPKRAGDFLAAESAIAELKSVKECEVMTRMIEERTWDQKEKDKLLGLIDDKMADLVAGIFEKPANEGGLYDGTHDFHE